MLLNKNGYCSYCGRLCTDTLGGENQARSPLRVEPLSFLLWLPLILFHPAFRGHTDWPWSTLSTWPGMDPGVDPRDLALGKKALFILRQAFHQRGVQSFL